MIIDNVKISGLGFFRNIKINFNSENINIIEGANGSGKTTLLALLYSMFQDEEKIEYEGEEAHIVLNVKEGKERICLEKYYKSGGSGLVVPSLGDMKRIASLNHENVYIYRDEQNALNYQADLGSRLLDIEKTCF